MGTIYVIGGANGAGKTTTAFNILPTYLQIIEYVNADEIAKGISPFNPEAVAIQAGKLMLKRLNYLKNNDRDFALETTLSSRNYVRFLNESKQKGYTINLLFFWLNSPELSVLRVKQRVKSGGHDIPEDVIYRRYQRGLKNLFNSYLSLCDNWFIYDNSQFPVTLIAKYTQTSNLFINDSQKWQQIKGVNYE
ncbi:MAG: zeta toxin family protein [Sediminibacterium sp.]|uniref:zeta toxin family protein n=1 Tax=Planktothrix agardhii TaxID=1160 RepID=UPI001D0B5108|nr:zeta toxin family protein [Planktothrix agardhii]MCF3609561.1 zeta toxin family protein [Planktothrix agardhii 1033]MCB8752744.1 zeta toxin family protein [Planktothrix agardhii 1810]MCF3591677.1 zeta toxin family protein [Planktothrix agardhii 1029]MCF3618857.1 zeta toxin family protein [Planktothrix agardhii 1030]MCF3648104.1 zeta toxin family protein [Planktothrix agardhii 1026]